MRRYGDYRVMSAAAVRTWESGLDISAPLRDTRVARERALAAVTGLPTFEDYSRTMPKYGQR